MGESDCSTYTLESTNAGMCADLLADAGYDPAEHADVVAAMGFAADLAAVDVAYEVMREHGLKPLADQRADRDPGLPE
jgi:predicted Zn-dependent protease